MKKVLLLIVCCIFALSACQADKKADTKADADKATTETKKVEEKPKAAAPNIEPLPADSEPILVISTELGDMKVKLYKETPKHRDNFVHLAKQGFFDGTLFHRVIKNFMIQGGDPDSKNATPTARFGKGGPGYTIPAEFNEKFYHKKGALSAARKPDQVNPSKASSGSQFYVVQGQPTNEMALAGISTQNKMKYTDEQKEVYGKQGGTPFLDGGYTVFGEVIEGLDIIDKIAAVETSKELGDRPKKDLTMTVKVVSE